ncbi:MAG TPA: SPOR domain-containing protein [Acidobacteriota bacterium]|nr:SPOR domain-containing protein [Acidobacteriota bacterium]HQF88315.1 SPOR domain-containing protein [Acidobacteriota bacterium]HQG93021.1 SPOR domain-containing protein [Acidobacteriota bacterium]
MRDKDNSKEKTVVLNNRDIVLMFAFFVVVLVVVFTIGLMVGRSFTEPVDESALAGQPTGAGDKAPAPAGVEPSPAIEEITLPPPRDDTTRAGIPPSTQTAPQPPPQPTTQPVAVATPPAAPTTPTTAPAAAGPKPAPATAPAPTKPVPQTTTPAAPTVAGTTYFVVQAMATRDLAEARQMVDRLKGKGYDAFVKIADAGSSDGMHRVQVGKFKDQAHARELVARLKKDGFEAFPRKVTE